MYVFSYNNFPFNYYHYFLRVEFLHLLISQYSKMFYKTICKQKCTLNYKFLFNSCTSSTKKF
jgi:hypothetical protein